MSWLRRDPHLTLANVHTEESSPLLGNEGCSMGEKNLEPTNLPEHLHVSRETTAASLGEGALWERKEARVLVLS